MHVTNLRKLVQVHSVCNALSVPVVVKVRRLAGHSAFTFALRMSVHSGHTRANLDGVGKSEAQRLTRECAERKYSRMNQVRRVSLATWEGTRRLCVCVAKRQRRRSHTGNTHTHAAQLPHSGLRSLRERASHRGAFAIRRPQSVHSRNPH